MTEIGFCGIHFSSTIISLSKCVDNSGLTVLTIPFWLMINKRSSGLNSPNSSPLLSTFKRCTVSSNQIFRGFKVETPSDFNSIFLMACFVTIFPRELRPLMAKSEKSISHFNFFTLPVARKLMVIVSASPFGFSVK